MDVTLGAAPAPRKACVLNPMADDRDHAFAHPPAPGPGATRLAASQATLTSPKPQRKANPLLRKRRIQDLGQLVGFVAGDEQE